MLKTYFGVQLAYFCTTFAISKTELRPFQKLKRIFSLCALYLFCIRLHQPRSQCWFICCNLWFFGCNSRPTFWRFAFWRWRCRYRKVGSPIGQQLKPAFQQIYLPQLFCGTLVVVFFWMMYFERKRNKSENGQKPIFSPSCGKPKINGMPTKFSKNLLFVLAEFRKPLQVSF